MKRTNKLMIVAIVVDTEQTVLHFPTGAVYILQQQKKDCGLVSFDLSNYSFVWVLCAFWEVWYST
jgi:hypothetical protein